MSRLPTLTPTKLVAALRRAGFIEHHQRGSHLFLWHPRRGVMVSVPVHARDLKRALTKAVLKQAHLTEEALRKLL